VTNTWQGWCEAPGDNKVYHNPDEPIRILREQDTDKYYISINRTGVVYETGYFFLQILYEPKATNIEINRQNSINKHNKAPSLFMFNNKNLIDVTDVYLEKSVKTDSSQVLVACDRAARIRVDCESHTSMQVRTCEFNFSPSSRKYCWQPWRVSKGQKECFSIDEYELDEDEPEVYLRICQAVGRYEEDSDIPFVVSGLISAVSLRFETILIY